MRRFVCALNLYPRKKRDITACSCAVNFTNYVKAMGQIYKNKEFFHKQYKNLNGMRDDVYGVLCSFRVGLRMHFDDEYNYNRAGITASDSLYVPVKVDGKWRMLCFTYSTGRTREEGPKCVLYDLNLQSALKVINGNEVNTWKQIISSLARSYHLLHDNEDLKCYQGIKDMYSAWQKLISYRKINEIDQPVVTELHYVPPDMLPRYGYASDEDIELKFEGGELCTKWNLKR